MNPSEQELLDMINEVRLEILDCYTRVGGEDFYLKVIGTLIPIKTSGARK